MNFRELALLFTVFVIVFAICKLWKALNSPDGERYLKRRMQGPFVPVTPEEEARGTALGQTRPK